MNPVIDGLLNLQGIKKVAKARHGIFGPKKIACLQPLNIRPRNQAYDK